MQVMGKAFQALITALQQLPFPPVYTPVYGSERECCPLGTTSSAMPWGGFGVLTFAHVNVHTIT